MRTSGSNRETTEKAIRKAAVKTIAKHGFHAASLRTVASEVGIQAGSLYNYINSKEEFLFRLLKEALERMISEYHRRTKGVTDPIERLKAFIELHIELHTEQQEEVIIGNMELRNLSPANYDVVTSLRDVYSGLLTGIIRDGAAQGLFQVKDPRIATFALLAMLTGICYWYRPRGRLKQHELMKMHTDMAFALLGTKTRLPSVSSRKEARLDGKSSRSKMRQSTGIRGQGMIKSKTRVSG